MSLMKQMPPGRMSFLASWLMVLCLSSWAVVGWAQSAESGRWPGRLLETNDDFTCLVDGDGRIKCPGNDANTEGAWPDKVFQSIANGDWGVCGLAADGQALCRSWRYVPGTFPSGQWRMLSIGWNGGCGVRPDGRIGCWGAWTGLSSSIPADGPFQSVVVGDHDACALRADGTLACWNERLSMDPDFGPPPPGRHLKVDIGSSLACALRSDGAIACWGPYRDREDVRLGGNDFIDLSVGYAHVCGLRIDGEVVCRGSTRRHGTTLAMPSPQGRFTEITSGDDRACGRRVDGIVTCWGEDAHDDMLVSDPSVPLTRMLTGGGEVCVLDPDGHPQCFGERPALAPPPGRYLQLALGADSACGIDLQHRVRCWGASLGPSPTLPMSAIAIADMHACGVGLDGRLACWGADGIGLGAVPEGSYRSVVTGSDFGCALSTSGSVACWGTNPLVSGIPVGDGFTQLHAGQRTACASRDGEALKCWGDVPAWYRGEWIFAPQSLVIGDHFLCWLSQGDVLCHADPTTGLPAIHGGIMTALAGTADTLCTVNTSGWAACEGAVSLQGVARTLRAGRGQLATGGEHTCSADNAGSIACWGDDRARQATPTIGSTGRFDASGDHTCATDSTNLLHCWGDGQRGANLTPPGLQVRDMDLGQFGGCGIDRRGIVACWGWNANGQTTPPPERFRRVATGLNHSCGVRDDGTLVCWGYGADGQLSAPAGTYLAVDVGERHACAIAADGRLRCWGLDSEGQASPPQDTDTYVALSVGAFHACAIRSDGTLVCWGRNDRGQSTPPAGRFVSVAAGGSHTCAIRDNGARACWGDNSAGQAPSLSLAPETLPPRMGKIGERYDIQFMLAASYGYMPANPVFRIVGGNLSNPEALSEDGHLVLYLGDPTAIYRFTVEVRDANGLAATRDYVLQADLGTDTTASMVDVSISGPMGDNGWHVGDVRVAWTVDDRESGIVEISGCTSYTQTSDTAGYIDCTARNRAGLSTRVQRPLKRDTTSPVIHVWYWPALAPNDNGWFNAPEYLRYGCSDATSGTTDDCPPDAAFVTEGVHVPRLHTVRDSAGNIATTSQTPIRIDWTPPMLDAVMPPSELPVGATHDYQASAIDALSGVASLICTPIDTSPYDGSPGGPERQARCTAIDRAGNAAVKTSTYTVVSPVSARDTDGRIRRMQSEPRSGTRPHTPRRGPVMRYKRAR